MKDRRFLRTVKDAMKGNEESFDLLMRLRSRNILYIAISIMQDKNAGEEIAQEAAASMQRNISKLKSPEAFDSWMYRIVYNECMDEKKRMARVQDHKEIDSEVEEMILERRDEFLPEKFVRQEEKRAELLSVINELPDKYRICILLFYYEDMNYQEIADVMDISGHDVANYLRRAKKKLRQQLVGGDARSVEPGLSVAQTKSAGVFAATPVITQVFKLDEGKTITSSMVEHFTTVNTASAVAVGSSTAAKSSSMGISGTFVSMSESMFIRVAVSFACAAAIAGGVLYAVNQSDPESRDYGPADTIEVGTGESNSFESPTTEEIIEDAGLDKIQAVRLSDFATDEKSEEEWANFTEEAQLYYLGKALDRTSAGDYQYSVYLFDDLQSPKLLMTVERKDNSGNVLVAYNTFTRGSMIPESLEMVEAFNAWR